MTTMKSRRLSGTARAVSASHAWEMVSGFMLRLSENQSAEPVEMLAPIAAALRPYGLDDAALLAISAEVDRVGEELRGCCPEGRLDCVSVRVHLSCSALRASQHAPAKLNQRWDFFVVKNIASSESDNLDAMEDPRCFIDLHVFEGV